MSNQKITASDGSLSTFLFVALFFLPYSQALRYMLSWKFSVISVQDTFLIWASLTLLLGTYIDSE